MAAVSSLYIRSLRIPRGIVESRSSSCKPISKWGMISVATISQAPHHTWHHIQTVRPCRRWRLIPYNAHCDGMLSQTLAVLLVYYTVDHA